MAFDEANRFLQEQGSKAFPFEAIGDRVTGTIATMDVRQQTDIETGEPQSWADGRPKMMIVITLQTELQSDETDDGLRSIYLRGGNPRAAKGKGTSGLNAVRDALKRSGAKDLEPGGTLTVAYSGEGEKSNKAWNAPKLYEATYEAPKQSVSLDDLT